MIKMTAHEKRVEIAKAGATRYGVYIDGGSTEALAKAVSLVGPVVMSVLENTTSSNKAKIEALSLLKHALPSVNGASISNTNIEMS